MMARRALFTASLLLACGDSTSTTSFGTTATGTGPGTTTTTTTGSTSTGTTDSPTTGPGSTSAASSTSSTSSSTTSTATSTTGGITSTSTSTSGTTSTGTTSLETSSSSSTDTTDSTSTGSSTSTGDPGALPPSYMGQCTQGLLSTFAAPMPVEPELHIIGVYEPTVAGITVNVNRTDIPLTLVLSSYEPVAFTLVLAPGVILDHVILNGYNKHTVQGQGAAMVTDLSENNYLSACAYVWPNGDGGCETPPLVAGAEGLTGLTLTGFAGCYQADQFTLD
jgi:hypothetical protein